MKKVIAIIAVLAGVYFCYNLFWDESSDSDTYTYYENNLPDRSNSQEGRVVECYRCHGNKLCSHCDGDGFRNGRRCSICNGSGECEACNGKGEFEVIVINGKDYIECGSCHKTGLCGLCGGTGEVGYYTENLGYFGGDCNLCHGSGECLGCQGTGYRELSGF